MQAQEALRAARVVSLMTSWVIGNPRETVTCTCRQQDRTGCRPTAIVIALVVAYHIMFLLFERCARFCSRFEIVFEGAGFEEVPLDETNLLVSSNEPT